MQILVVDDNPQSVELLEVLLQGHGYEVTAARNGVEALEMLFQERHDLIISDILMPEMDGFQLCRTVKQHPRMHDIPFIFYTATYTDPEDHAFGLSLGAEFFLIKPQDPVVVLDTVQGLIGQGTGRPPVLLPPADVEEAVYLQGYNERLVHKLEEKVVELAETHRQLAASEALYRALIEQANDAVILCNPSARIDLVNPTFCAWFGYSAEEARQLHLRSLLHADEVDRVLTAFQSLVAGALSPTLGEVRCLTKTGDLLYADINPSVIVRAGTPIGVQAILRDLAQRKRLEAQLQQAKKAEAIGTMAGGIAHDFNNILAAILGYTEMSCSTLPNNHPVWRNLQEVLRAVNHAKELIQRMLEISHPTEEEYQPVRLSDLITEVLGMLRSILPSTITIRQQIMTESATVLASATQLHRVLVNLCMNAEHAMRPAGGTLEIKLDSLLVPGTLLAVPPDLKPELYARVGVRDTGHGMTPQVMERMFDPFFTTKGVGQGTGLGLATVQRIILDHQGIIAVRSTPGEGTTFDVYLPQFQEAPALPVSPAAPRLRGQEHILFVDDEAMLANLVQHMLERLGYTVTTYTSSAAALEAFQEAPQDFDLVITDQTMPGMNGLALAQAIRRLRPDMPIILCTGFSHAVSAETARAAGLNAFLMKPLGGRDLALAIRHILDPP